jgi:hypothetical protein
MATQGLIAVCHSLTDAEQAIRGLERKGFPMDQLSIVARDFSSEKEVQGYITTGDVAKQGAGVGAWVGGLFGVLMGAAFLWVPGFGPMVVAGPLAAALLGGAEGALAGAAAGGLLGALTGWGISKEQIIRYEDHLRAGKFLLIAEGTDSEVDEARRLLESSDVSEISSYSKTPEPAQTT